MDGSVSPGHRAAETVRRPDWQQEVSGTSARTRGSIGRRAASGMDGDQV